MGNSDVQGRILGLFADFFEPGEAEMPPLQFVPLSLLCFEGLGNGRSAELTPSLATQIPLDEVSTFR
jgi:hypothetical protein